MKALAGASGRVVVRCRSENKHDSMINKRNQRSISSLAGVGVHTCHLLWRQPRTLGMCQDSREGTEDAWEHTSDLRRAMVIGTGPTTHSQANGLVRAVNPSRDSGELGGGTTCVEEILQKVDHYTIACILKLKALKSYLFAAQSDVPWLAGEGGRQWMPSSERRPECGRGLGRIAHRLGNSWGIALSSREFSNF